MTELMSPPAASVQPRRFTSDEVQAMLRAGILHEDDRLELIEGQLIPTSPIGGPHIACINRPNHVFNKHLFTQEIEDMRQHPEPGADRPAQ